MCRQKESSETGKAEKASNPIRREDYVCTYESNAATLKPLIAGGKAY